MNPNADNVYFPTTLAEFFADWFKAPLAEPFSCDAFELVKQSGRRIEIPPQYVSLDFIDELKKISRTERYLEIGSKATLRDILRLGRSVPAILRQVLEGAASPLLHPLISFGACVQSKDGRNEIAGALTALDARYELKLSPASSRWLSASRYDALAEQGAGFGRELLVRIRVPLDEWDYAVYRKLRQIDDTGAGSMVVLLLAKMQKDILTDIRVVLAAGTVHREKGAESFLTGKHLPLAERDIEPFAAYWRDYLADIKTLSPMQQETALLCIESCISRFID
jgi:CO/xanthine dehydrogenase FAD-binding subunit